MRHRHGRGRPPRTDALGTGGLHDERGSGAAAAVPGGRLPTRRRERARQFRAPGPSFARRVAPRGAAFLSAGAYRRHVTHEPASHRTEECRLGRLPSGTDVTVPVHRYVGGEGPTVYVQAAQHGIELNGAAALRRLHGDLKRADLAGTLVVVPVANPLAFDNRSYTTPAAYDVSNPNPNRVWPGDENGTFQERLVARLWRLASDVDAVVDLHTGTADMLEHVRFREGDPEARAMAEAFGTEYLLADFEEGEGDGRLRAAAARTGIPTITAELSNSRRVSHRAVETGADGVRNVLRALDVLEPSPDPAPARTVLRDEDGHVSAATSGLFESTPDVAVGDSVDVGDPLGAVYCPSSFERLQTVTAETSGVVYSLAREAVVMAGERLASVAPPA